MDLSKMNLDYIESLKSMVGSSQTSENTLNFNHVFLPNAVKGGMRTVSDSDEVSTRYQDISFDEYLKRTK